MQASAHLPAHRYIASLFAALVRHPDLPPEAMEAWRTWLAGAYIVEPDDGRKMPTLLATLVVRPLQIQAWRAQVSVA